MSRIWSSQQIRNMSVELRVSYRMIIGRMLVGALDLAQAFCGFVRRYYLLNMPHIYVSFQSVDGDLGKAESTTIGNTHQAIYYTSIATVAV